MRANTIGCFSVCQASGREVTPRGLKARALLAYLVCNVGTKVSKARLAALLWGDRGDEQARSSLRQVIMELRGALNETHQVFVSDREHVWLACHLVSEAEISPSDEHREWFEDLDDITAEYDEWLAAERSRRGTKRLRKLEGKADKLIREGRGAEAAAVADRMEAIDPCNETALQFGMEADFQRGHAGAIMQRFQRTAKHLRDDLGVNPAAESSEMRDRLVRDLTKRDRSVVATETDRDHYRRRATHEREAAARAKDERSRLVHQTLADRYQEIADAL